MELVGENGEDDGFLEGLPSTTRKYQYEGSNALGEVVRKEHRILDEYQTREKSQFVIFLNVYPSIFDQDITQQRFVRVDSYYRQQKALIVKMNTTPHEAAHSELFLLMNFQLERMSDAHQCLVMVGQAIVHTPSRSKKPDQSIKPLHPPSGRSTKWPSFVIESGLSESKSKLAADARWWLNESSGDVKTALTISVHRTKPELVIQNWRLEPRPTRADPQKSIPMVEQDIRITKTQEGEVRVRNGPLIIPFENVFLRPPTAQAQEQDFLFTDQSIESLGRKVWTLQGF